MYVCMLCLCNGPEDACDAGESGLLLSVEHRLKHVVIRDIVGGAEHGLYLRVYIVSFLTEIGAEGRHVCLSDRCLRL